MIPTINLEGTGERIRTLMDERNMTVKDVANELGFGCVQGVYKWLQGRGLPSVDNLLGLSHVFQVTIDDILVLEERG